MLYFHKLWQVGSNKFVETYLTRRTKASNKNGFCVLWEYLYVTGDVWDVTCDNAIVH